MTIIFFGTSSFSATILETILADTRFEVLAIVTAPDKPVGRKQIMQASAVAQIGIATGIPVHKFTTLRTTESAEILTAYAPDFFLVAAYGKIIPQNILDIPKIQAVNVHTSLLPKYRGAAPIHGALLSGESKTGVTIMAMDAEVDHGGIYTQYELDIQPDECEPQLESRLAALSMQHIADDLERISNGSLQAIPQNHTEATFTKIIAKEDGRVDWNKSAEEIYNQFRAYYEWPGIFTTYDGKRIKILDCQAVAQSSGSVGTVSQQDSIILIACPKGSLQLFTVQLEGKNPASIQDFINGHKEFIGSVLS